MLTGYGALATFIHNWKEYRYLYNHFGSCFWYYLLKSNMYIYPHPVIPLLGMQFIFIKVLAHQKWSTKMFIAAFVIVKKWNLDRLLTVEWIDKLQYIHTMEYSRGWQTTCKYFRLCRPHSLCHIFLMFIFCVQYFKNVKTILSSKAM